MTPEQIARFSLEVGREVTELVQRRLAEAVQWGPTHHPGWAGEVIPAPGVYAEDQFDTDGGVKAEVIRTVKGE